MKFNYNLFVFILGIVSGFAPQMAWAEKCPAGCFCLGSGEYSENPDYSGAGGSIESLCHNYHARPIENYADNARFSFCNDVEIFSHKYPNEYPPKPTYYIEDFSEFYYDAGSGGYGFKDGNLLFFSTCHASRSSKATPRVLGDMYNCPDSHPFSDAGSQFLHDCYNYDASGNKIHYSQGKLKTIDYNGWVPLVSCQPGYYMPANSTKCSSCSGNNACPGGMFYTDKTYTADRGIIACENGVSSDRTSCRVGGTAATTTTSSTPPASTTTTITIQSSSGNNVSAGTTSTSSTSGGNNDSDTTATTPSSGTVSSSGTGGGTTSTIAKLSDLNPTIAGSRNTQKEAAKTWSVTFPYGDVSGIASCNDTNGTYAMAYPQYNFDNNYASSTGKYCWCKMTIPNGPSSWVGAGNTISSSICAASCASRCGSYTRGNSSFRTSIFSMATGSTGFSSSSSVTDPNADIKAKLQNGVLSKWFGLLGGKSAVPQVGRAAVYDGVPSRGASISIAGKAANQRSATGTNDAQRSSTSDKAVRENPRGTNKSNRN